MLKYRDIWYTYEVLFGKLACTLWLHRCQNREHLASSFRFLFLLEHVLCDSPILHSPDFTKEFVLQTDKSDRRVGEVLSQLDVYGNDHPVLFYSRKLLSIARDKQTGMRTVSCEPLTLNQLKPQPTLVSQEKGGGVSGSHSSHPVMDRLYSVARLTLVNIIAKSVRMYLEC